MMSEHTSVRSQTNRTANDNDTEVLIRFLSSEKETGKPDLYYIDVAAHPEHEKRSNTLRSSTKNAIRCTCGAPAAATHCKVRAAGSAGIARRNATTGGVRVEAHPASTKPRAKSATQARSSTVLESTPPPRARRSTSFPAFFALHGPRRRPRAARRGGSATNGAGAGVQTQHADAVQLAPGGVRCLSGCA